MSKGLSKHQSIEIIKIIALTIIGMVAIYYVGVRFFMNRVGKKELEITDVRTKIQVAENTGQKMALFQEDLEIGMETLKQKEQAIAQGDYYVWILQRLDQFSRKYNLTNLQVERPLVRDWILPPKVEGYRLANFTVKGHAYFHDFGAFVADLENSLPYLRITRLRLDSTGAGFNDIAASEKLTFEVNFLNPFKPSMSP